MNMKITPCLTASIIALYLGLAASLGASGQYFKVDYPASTVAGELQLGVTYTIWIPDGVNTLRGVIVHQHGAGTIAAKSGMSAAYDLHWQALAKKWDCALLGPSYHVLTEKTDDSPGGSQLWFDPRRGSDKTFLKALSDFATTSGHAELERVPWTLWGHSGGAIWSHIMTVLHPDRVAAVWLRSGSAFMWKGKAGFAPLETSPAVYSIPIMCNSGIQEKGNGPWNGPLAMVQDYRAKGAPIGFAPDPLTGHWCGNSRYLAIPYLDACMALRLPEKGSHDQTLRPVNQNAAWLAPLLGDTVQPAAGFKGNAAETVWLPNETIAKDWVEYVRTGGVSDSTPPPAPSEVTVVSKDLETDITWNAEADFESGIHHFIVLRDGQELGNLPEKNLIRFQVRPAFQMTGAANGWTASYNDAPADPVPPMRFVDTWPKDKKNHTYAIIAVNTVGLKSAPSAPATTTDQP